MDEGCTHCHNSAWLLETGSTKPISIRPNEPTIHHLEEGQRSRPFPALITHQSIHYNHMVVMHSPSASYPVYPAKASKLAWRTPAQSIPTRRNHHLGILPSHRPANASQLLQHRFESHTQNTPQMPMAHVEFVTSRVHSGMTTTSEIGTTSSNSSVATGPAGRALAQPMEAALVEALQNHLTIERQASATYFAMAIWFAERELRGFAHFFKHESHSEQEHAATFADYLIARGQTVLLQEMTAPRQDWVSAEQIMAASFELEVEVTTSLQQLYTMAERAADLRTTVFLDPLIDAQVSSENEFAHLLGRVRFCQGQPAAMLIVDGELSDDKHSPAKLA